MQDVVFDECKWLLAAEVVNVPSVARVKRETSGALVRAQLDE